MTIRVIKKVENMFKTVQRPSWYPTFLVECSGCWKRFPMIKYEIWKTRLCCSCASSGEWRVNTRESKKINRLWMKNTNFYKKRQCIRARCTYHNTHWFKNYWGRWIKCLWTNFKDFYDDMYISYLEYVKEHWEKDTTIDRIDVNGHYCKENCRWRTMLEQQSNKRNNHSIVYKWKKYPTIKWLCDMLWKNYQTVHRRICKYWWDVEDAIDKPIYHKRSAL